MRIATTIFLTDETITPVRLAQELEQRGFAGLYLPEHSHIPVSRESPYPAGGPLPREYARTLDQFVALGQAAAVTERIGLATGITLIPQHDPIDLAKQVATLDFLSGGRFTLGIGFGWNVEEAADHGVDWSRRLELGRQRLGVMRALWAEEPTAYDGTLASVQASEAYPKPVQRPRAHPDGPLTGPRTLIGGAASPGLFRRITEYGDGWLPIGGSGLGEALPQLRRTWEEAGRDPKTLHVVPYAVQPSPGKLTRFADLGIDEVVVQLPAGDEGEVLRTLDAYAQYL